MITCPSFVREPHRIPSVGVERARLHLTARPMLLAALAHLLLAGAVVARGPRRPLTRHRDVLTTQGSARGYFAPRPPHYAYLGLPYARPPTHARFKISAAAVLGGGPEGHCFFSNYRNEAATRREGRDEPAVCFQLIASGDSNMLKAPRPPPSWDGTFEATHRVKCLQPDGSGSRDCLVLNVFAPEPAHGLPVLVHVHGGGFQRGWCMLQLNTLWGLHTPPVRLLRLGFVVVTFNYRLGALGFLCLRTPGAPGNAGLKDQVAALYWVHRNIAQFGGNPQDVTLYGTGSGGVSVELLLLSDVTSSLVHKAIIESGAVLSPSSISSDPFALGVAGAVALGFQGGSPEDLEIFYNSISIYNIINATQIVHLPCVENNALSNSILDMDPMEILKHGIYQHVPLLICYKTAEEVKIIRENTEMFNTAPNNFEQLMPTNLEFETEDVRYKMAALVKDFYFDEYELSESVVQNYIDYVNDIFMEYPIAKSSALHAAKSQWPVYLMKYIYKGGITSTASDEAEVGGNIYNYIFADGNIDGPDEVIANRLLTLWSNFVKLGDPTPITSSLIPVIWQPVSAQHIAGRVNIGKISYLQFDRTMTNVEPQGQQLIFWDYIYDKFYKHHGQNPLKVNN